MNSIYHNTQICYDRAGNKTAFIVAEEEENERSRRWNMYLEIQDLKKMHFNVSQISDV